MTKHDDKSLSSNWGVQLGWWWWCAHHPAGRYVPQPFFSAFGADSLPDRWCRTHPISPHVQEKSIFCPMHDANGSQVKKCDFANVRGPRLRNRLPTQAQVGAETDSRPSAILARAVPTEPHGIVKNEKCAPTSGSGLHPLPRTLTSRKQATQDPAAERFRFHG
jgi:hypothetical protein